MMIWFLDSSALVKRYVREQGSELLRKEIGKHSCFVAQVTPVEMTAAFSKKLRTGRLSKFEFHQARRRFMRRLNGSAHGILLLTQETVELAQRLTFTRSLRAYDAIQLATALIALSGGDQSRFRIHYG